MLGAPYLNGEPREFSHVVEILMEDDEVKYRVQGMRMDPIDGNVYSKWEREERKKPKVIPEGEEEPPEEDENAPKPLDENTLIQRINDMEDSIREELLYYNSIERPSMEDLLLNMYDNQFLKVDSAGLTPDEICASVVSRIKPDSSLPLRPIALQIEGGSDFKSLLTEGQEEN
jgi:hypothetical protein